MAVNKAAILVDVAGRLGVSEALATAAVDAAIDYIAGDVGVLVADLPADDVRLESFGVPLLAMRMFQDAPLPSGGISEFDPTFAGVIVPRRLYEHLDEYWRHLTTNWGVA